MGHAMDPFRFTPGRSPLVVSMPHVGLHVPGALAGRLTAEARPLPDTDWHVDRLYGFLDALDATVIAATHSRYVIDLNRAPDSRALYPGADNTELCPTTTFDRAPIYRAGQEPDADEVAERRERYWQPYHERLGAALDDVRRAHGLAVLWDAHSIRSQVPRFFEGRLPDLNLGTAGGTSAAGDLTQRVVAVAAAAGDAGYSHVLDGRFKGGHITRTYGRSAAGVHAIQLELSQITYMDEDPPYAFREDLAGRIRPVLRRCLEAVCDWARATGSG
jgi:N-formylglutamate deformylase